MKKYVVKIQTETQSILVTAVYAESDSTAMQIAQLQFSPGRVVGRPIEETNTR